MTTDFKDKAKKHIEDTLAIGALTTGLGYPQEPFTMDKLLEAIEAVKNLPPPNDKWILVNPQGEMMVGTVEQILPHIVRQHPLFKTISFIERLKFED